MKTPDIINPTVSSPRLWLADWVKKEVDEVSWITHNILTFCYDIDKWITEITQLISIMLKKGNPIDEIYEIIINDLTSIWNIPLLFIIQDRFMKLLNFIDIDKKYEAIIKTYFWLWHTLSEVENFVIMDYVESKIHCLKLQDVDWLKQHAYNHIKIWLPIESAFKQ